MSRIRRAQRCRSEQDFLVSSVPKQLKSHPDSEADPSRLCPRASRSVRTASPSVANAARARRPRRPLRATSQPARAHPRRSLPEAATTGRARNHTAYPEMRLAVRRLPSLAYDVRTPARIVAYSDVPQTVAGSCNCFPRPTPAHHKGFCRTVDPSLLRTGFLQLARVGAGFLLTVGNSDYISN